jgi:hypothetical protein
MLMKIRKAKCRPVSVGPDVDTARSGSRMLGIASGMMTDRQASAPDAAARPTHPDNSSS